MTNQQYYKLLAIQSVIKGHLLDAPFDSQDLGQLADLHIKKLFAGQLQGFGIEYNFEDEKLYDSLFEQEGRFIYKRAMRLHLNHVCSTSFFMLLGIREDHSIFLKTQEYSPYIPVIDKEWHYFKELA